MVDDLHKNSLNQFLKVISFLSQLSQLTFRAFAGCRDTPVSQLSTSLQQAALTSCFKCRVMIS